MKFGQVIGLVAAAAVASGAAIDVEKRQSASLACISAAHGEGFYQGSFHADCQGLVRTLTSVVGSSDVMTQSVNSDQ